MILHFLTDDKFADYAIKQFSAPEMKSEFVCLNTAGRMELVTLRDKVPVMSPYSEEFVHFLEGIGNYSAIVFHGMLWGTWQAEILRKVPAEVKVAWYFWGGEIYTRHEIGNRFLAPITNVMFRLYAFNHCNFRDLSWEIPLELYKRVDYCLTAEYEEYEFAKQFTQASFKYLWYTCYSLEETIGPLMNSSCEGSNIWIGNSAAVENNHLDVLWNVWRSGVRHRVKNRIILMPLSYGSQWMKRPAIKFAHLLFGNNVQVLEKFIPRNDYNALMLSCSTMIIGYWEPASQGNIITALWLGMRVYLSEKSIAFAFFKRIGVKIFSIEKDLKVYHFIPLSNGERIENRKVLTEWFAKQHVIEAVHNVVHALQ